MFKGALGERSDESNRIKWRHISEFMNYVWFYMKKELVSTHIYMAFYASLNRFLPSFIHINGSLYKPRITKCQILIKEAVGGKTLLNWMNEKVIDNLSMFAASFCINSVVRHLCGITDRHPNNIKIIPERNEYGLGISKPIGIDIYGTWILFGLHEFFGDSLTFPHMSESGKWYDIKFMTLLDPTWMKSAITLIVIRFKKYSKS
jgi:hypothetical protein